MILYLTDQNLIFTMIRQNLCEIEIFDRIYNENDECT